MHARVTAISGSPADADVGTLWDDEQSLRATEESANALLAGAADDMGARDAAKVGRNEVAVFEV